LLRFARKRYEQLKNEPKYQEVLYEPPELFVLAYTQAIFDLEQSYENDNVSIDDYKVS
jgi:hypothetical protein